MGGWQQVFECCHVCTLCYSIVVWLGIQFYAQDIAKELSVHHVVHPLSPPESQLQKPSGSTLIFL